MASRKDLLATLLVLLSAGCFGPSYLRDEDMILAASRGDHVAVHRLLAEGANIEARDEGEHTALFAAATNGHLDVVKLLISKGADVNARDTHGTTVLDMAADVEVRRALIRAGAKSSHDLPPLRKGE